MIELVDRAAIELSRRHEFIARPQQGMKGDQLRRMARCQRQRRRPALEGGDARLQHRRGRVHDPGIDIAECPQREQVGGMLDILEDKGGGLVDRGDPGTGHGIGLRTGVNGEGAETGRVVVVGHPNLPGEP